VTCVAFSSVKCSYELKNASSKPLASSYAPVPIPKASRTIRIPCPRHCPTQPTIRETNVLLERIWKPGFRYAKAGVILMDFYEQGALQTDLFRPESGRTASKGLMSVVDKINHSGLGNVFYAAVVDETRASLASVYNTVGGFEGSEVRLLS